MEYLFGDDIQNDPVQMALVSLETQMRGQREPHGQKRTRIDAAIDEALLDFMEKRRTALPASNY